MLIRFVVNNFLSFREETEFSMIAGNYKTHAEHVYSSNGKLNILKSAAIYGANGAGKSNLVKAIHFLQEVVFSGEIKEPIDNKKFKLDISNAEKPISFEIEFSIEKKIYSYGVSLIDFSISEEWLYESGVTKKDKLIFERTQTKEGKSSIKMASKYQKTPKDRLLIKLMEENLLKNNELFLGKNDTLKILEIKHVWDWIVDSLIIIYPGSKFDGLVPSISSKRFNNFTNELLKTLDTGVNGLGIDIIDFDMFFAKYDDSIKKDVLQKLNNEKTLLFRSDIGTVFVVKKDEKISVLKVISLHNSPLNKDIIFDISDESDGTQRLLDLIPAFDRIIQYDQTFIVDEIDRSLHPALLKSLVRKIMEDNTTKGQLVFTTHESNLLDMDIFRQDEIWFVEKDRKTCGTQLYSLSEYKPRYDLDIRKGYLNGRFGAIPFLANLEDLNWHTQNA